MTTLQTISAYIFGSIVLAFGIVYFRDQIEEREKRETENREFVKASFEKQREALFVDQYVWSMGKRRSLGLPGEPEGDWVRFVPQSVRESELGKNQ